MTRSVFLRSFVPLFLIAVLGCAIYANSLHGKFVLDDQFVIEQNPRIKSGLTLSKVINDDFSPGGKARFGFYRPLTTFSFRISYTFGKLNSSTYHLTNTILHILVALAVYWLILILFQEKLLALLTALFFVAHPVQVESVAYISDRADLLVVLCILLGLIFYVKQLEDKRVLRNTALLVLCFAAILLLKENGIVFPALLALYHACFRKPARVSVFVLLCGMAGAYLFARSFLFKVASLKAGVAHSALERVPGLFVAITNYIRLMVLPYNLHIDYGRPLFKFSHPQALLGMGLVAAFLVYAFLYIFRSKRGSPLVFFCISWFLISLAPVSNIYPLFSYMAEHFLYLPSLGVCLLLAAGFSRLSRIKKCAYCATALAACLVLAYSALSMAQNKFWRNPQETYTRLLKYNPHSTIALLNLSNIYKEQGELDKAIDLLKRLLALEPHNARALNNLGTIYERLGLYQEAMALFKKPLQTESSAAIPYNNLGVMNEKAGHFDTAIALYKESIKANPNYVTPYNNLGVIYEQMGKTEEAIALYKKAISLNPDEEVAYNNLGSVYEKQGKVREAMALYMKAIQCEPDYAKAYYNLGNAYTHQKEFPEAEKAYLKAVAIDPAYVDAYYNLGVVYERMQKYQDALAVYHKAFALAPKYARVLNNIGSVYYKLGREGEAVAFFKKAIEADPKHARAYDNLSKYYFKQKQYKLAIEYCDKASECGLKNAKLQEALAPYRQP
ncbi:MAG TPA: tetratricopeptide repeat protein [Patescibacteria group bacterium]|nr:tetratricopeptide repeat protein [Patescibacteria group bacterium]